MQRLHDLVRAGEPGAGDPIGRFAGDVFAAKHDLAEIGLGYAVDEIEHGRLAGAVGSNQPYDLTVVDREADIVHGLQAAEALAQSDDLQKGGHSSAFRVRGQRR